jgi:hypothetical protein
MSLKDTTDRAKSGQDEPAAGLLGESTPWVLLSWDVQFSVDEPRSTDRPADCILILSSTRLVQEAPAAVLTHTFRWLGIRAATSRAQVQAQLNCAILGLVTRDATRKIGSTLPSFSNKVI